MKVYCKYCGRYLLEAVGTTIVEAVICPNSRCKARLNLKVCNNDSTIDQLRHKCSQTEIKPKSFALPPYRDS
jgi:hypothetical protein